MNNQVLLFEIFYVLIDKDENCVRNRTRARKKIVPPSFIASKLCRDFSEHRAVRYAA